MVSWVLSLIIEKFLKKQDVNSSSSPSSRSVIIYFVILCGWINRALRFHSYPWAVINISRHNPCSNPWTLPKDRFLECAIPGSGRWHFEGSRSLLLNCLPKRLPAAPESAWFTTHLPASISSFIQSLLISWAWNYISLSLETQSPGLAPVSQQGENSIRCRGFQQTSGWKAALDWVAGSWRSWVLIQLCAYSLCDLGLLHGPLPGPLHPAIYQFIIASQLPPLNLVPWAVPDV